MKCKLELVYIIDKKKKNRERERRWEGSLSYQHWASVLSYMSYIKVEIVQPRAALRWRTNTGLINFIRQVFSFQLQVTFISRQSVYLISLRRHAKQWWYSGRVLLSGSSRRRKGRSRWNLQRLKTAFKHLYHLCHWRSMWWNGLDAPQTH